MHQINLHGPWSLRSADKNNDETVRVRFPCMLADSPLPDHTSFHLSRKFHAPTGLTSDQKVLLYLEFHRPPTRMVLNQCTLRPLQSSPHRFDITNQLEVFNELDLEFEQVQTSKKEQKIELDEPVNSVFVQARLEIV